MCAGHHVLKTMDSNTTPYRLPSFYFRVAVPDTAVISCSEVSGLDNDMGEIAYRSGDSIIRLPHMAGIRKSGDVTLKLCRADDMQAITAWHDAVRANNIRRKAVTVELLDEQQNAVKRWHLTNAWPKKIVTAASETDADADAIAFDTIILAHEGVTEE